jgi:hypothetical protein
MQRRWTGRNVDLNLLSASLEDFLKSRQVVTQKLESAGEHMILLQSKYSTVKLKEPVSVRIAGEPDDFIVDLKASELVTRSIRIGMLTKPIGGGYYLLRSLKLQEELEKLEKEFWIFVEDKVAQLSQSAQRPK